MRSLRGGPHQEREMCKLPPEFTAGLSGARELSRVHGIPARKITGVFINRAFTDLYGSAKV